MQATGAPVCAFRVFLQLSDDSEHNTHVMLQTTAPCGSCAACEADFSAPHCERVDVRELAASFIEYLRLRCTPITLADLLRTSNAPPVQGMIIKLLCFQGSAFLIAVYLLLLRN
jgi:threonine dehydrogenase-like Zn-dependent dehydrogenase